MRALLLALITIYIPASFAETPMAHAPDFYQEAVPAKPAPVFRTAEAQPAPGMQQRPRVISRHPHEVAAPREVARPDQNFYHRRVISRHEQSMHQPRVIRYPHPSNSQRQVIVRRPYSAPPRYVYGPREYQPAPPPYYDEEPRVYRRVYRQGPPPYRYYPPRAAYPILPPGVILQFAF